jgi:thiosulfate/3-mercaptopyruvate sulfurtransferase
MATILLAASELKKYIDQPDVMIIDASGGPEAYKKYRIQHVPGTVFVDLETELSQKKESAAMGGRHPLPDPVTFSKTLGKIGIKKTTQVIIYDDKAGANAAARLWWMLKSAGHEKVNVVNGGLKAIHAAGIEISNASVSRRPVEDYQFDEWLLPVANLEEVEHASKNQEALVIDVREAYRYNGESEPIDLVAGHIPGTINVPFPSNLKEDGTYRSVGELKDNYHSIIESRKPENIIVHCGSGVTACHTLLAMDEAGIKNAKLYVGSWSEWSRNDKPIATHT